MNQYSIVNAVQQKNKSPALCCHKLTPLGCRPVICITEIYQAHVRSRPCMLSAHPQSCTRSTKKSISNWRWRRTPRAIKGGSCRGRPLMIRLGHSSLHRLILESWFDQLPRTGEERQAGRETSPIPQPHCSLPPSRLETGLCTCFAHICASRELS